MRERSLIKLCRALPIDWPVMRGRNRKGSESELREVEARMKWDTAMSVPHGVSLCLLVIWVWGCAVKDWAYRLAFSVTVVGFYCD